MINYDTTFLDYPSPDGIAVIVFMSGCSHCCKGCQNPIFQQLYKRDEKDIGIILSKIDEFCERNNTNKLVLSGGDCLHEYNRNVTSQICYYFGNKLDICIYTGYSIDEVKQMNIHGFKYIKCGKFNMNNMQEAVKTDEYIQFVNPTQNLYDSEYKQLSENGRFYFN